MTESNSNMTDSNFNNMTESNSNMTDSNFNNMTESNSNMTDSNFNNMTESNSNMTDMSNLTDTNNLISQDNFNDKAFYILIKSVNNETTFDPDIVTLTAGDKVVWLNHDNSEHRVTVGSDSRPGYQLLNSLILPNGTIEHQFQLAGTYYSVVDDHSSKGTVTILAKGNEGNAVSIPLED
jgi:plastocyanin